MNNSVSDPAPVLELIEAFRRSKIMFGAVSLGVFEQLAAGPASAETLAKELNADSDALERLLNACVAMQLLTRDGDQFANTPIATTYLCRESPRQLTGYINFSNKILWQLWENLEDAVRDGTNRWRQTFSSDGPIFANLFSTEEAKREFSIGMHGFGQISSPAVVAAFDLGRFQRMVDLGGATGHLVIAACQRYPNLRAVVLDLQSVIPLAQEKIADAQLADRIEIVAGDFFVDPLPKGDLYAVGRILHDWSEDKIDHLLRRIYESLPPNGALLIAEKLLNDDKIGPMWAHLQSLNMLVVAEGKERTLLEYTALLKKAGFSKIEASRTPGPLDAILAYR
ncbi:MAG TPA: class I SAM-dependent methyltransferase [Lacipirellulaceae bacterium]|nr:class I SAM-dependent methyltransferase [Lacipirellulaceae bacterium]